MKKNRKKMDILGNILAIILSIVLGATIVVATEYVLRDHQEFDWCTRGLIFFVSTGVIALIVDKLLLED